MGSPSSAIPFKVSAYESGGIEVGLSIFAAQ